MLVLTVHECLSGQGRSCLVYLLEKGLTKRLHLVVEQLDSVYHACSC
jgi:hypothetical protein